MGQSLSATVLPATTPYAQNVHVNEPSVSRSQDATDAAHATHTNTNKNKNTNRVTDADDDNANADIECVLHGVLNLERLSFCANQRRPQEQEQEQDWNMLSPFGQWQRVDQIDQIEVASSTQPTLPTLVLRFANPPVRAELGEQLINGDVCMYRIETSPSEQHRIVLFVGDSGSFESLALRFSGSVPRAAATHRRSITCRHSIGWRTVAAWRARQTRKKERMVSTLCSIAGFIPPIAYVVVRYAGPKSVRRRWIDVMACMC